MRILPLTGLALLCAVTLLSAGVHASEPASPFAPGGPLQPWNGPLPAPSQLPYDQPGSPHQHVQRFPSAPAPVDADRTPLNADDKPHTSLSALFNPALTHFGKTTGRFELAPYGPHALFLELSKLSLDLQDKGYTVQVEGWEYDFGYHLFPLGQGARGFYIGARYIRGSGEAEGATGEFSGWGGDLGYQWVVANHLVFNLGAGAMHVSGSAEIDPAIVGNLDIPEGQASGFESLSSESGSYLLPLVTLGIGLAI